MLRHLPLLCLLCVRLVIGGAIGCIRCSGWGGGRSRTNGWILDSKLFEVGWVFGGIVIELLHLRTILVHRGFVEPDGRLVASTKKWLILYILRFDVVEVGLGLCEECGPGHQGEEGKSLTFRSADGYL